MEEQNLLLQTELIEIKAENSLLKNKVYTLENQIMELNLTINNTNVFNKNEYLEDYKSEKEIIKNSCSRCGGESFRQCWGNININQNVRPKCDKFFCYHCIKPTYSKYGDSFMCEDCKRLDCKQ